ARVPASRAPARSRIAVAAIARLRPPSAASGVLRATRLAPPRRRPRETRRHPRAPWRAPQARLPTRPYPLLQWLPVSPWSHRPTSSDVPAVEGKTQALKRRGQLLLLRLQIREKSIGRVKLRRERILREHNPFIQRRDLVLQEAVGALQTILLVPDHAREWI